MRKRSQFYCNLCHQEFDHLCEHGAGSFDDQGNRLNGYCPGDIRSRVLAPPSPKITDVSHSQN